MPENTSAFESFKPSEAKEFSTAEHLVALISSVDARLAAMRPEIEKLMELRHALYTIPTSLFDVARPTLDQLYDEPTYNDVFVYGYDPRLKITDDDPKAGADLASRRGVEFKDAETYDEGEYSRAILDSAVRLGFLKASIGHASNELDRQIGIADSELNPVGQVEAIIIPGAASISNVIRLRDTLRNLEEGRVETDTIIIASTDRKVSPEEEAKVRAIGFEAGATEYDSLIAELATLTNETIDPGDEARLPVQLGEKTFEGKVKRVTLELAGKTVNCFIVSAPFDPERVVRWDDDNQPVYATRANTDDTFATALSLLKPGSGRLLIESHDTWAVGQGVIAEQTFGIAGKDILSTGAQKLDRIVGVQGEDGETYLALNKPGEVVDEIAKTYAYLTQTRIKASNALTLLG